jgi:hypothetical protein
VDQEAQIKEPNLQHKTKTRTIQIAFVSAKACIEKKIGGKNPKNTANR